MKIWIDGDACPNPIKAILFKAAANKQIDTWLIANHYVKTANSPFVHFVHAPTGVDSVDNEIVRRCQAGDIIITQDIPLAAEVVDKKCLAITPRGELLDKSNIKQRLNMRDFFDTLRSSGIDTGGSAALSQKDRQNFANCLDRLISQYLNTRQAD